MRYSSLRPLRSLTASTLALVALACGDATGVEPDDLAGTWRATTATVTNPADSSESEDLVALGFNVTFIIEISGRIETILEFQGVEQRDLGTLIVTDGEFALHVDEIPSHGTISRRNDTLTMDFLSGVEWDFGADGFDEPATLFLIMVRDPESPGQ